MAEKQKNSDDPYARGSFSMRRMTRGQIWAIAVVAIAAFGRIVNLWWLLRRRSVWLQRSDLSRF